MFRKSAEQMIMREADKVVSMKEDIDAMSWSRVIEIAKLLQADHTDEQRQEWARELLSIARTNSWVLDKFGVSAEDMTGRVIPSGIEIQQNDRYLSGTAAAEQLSSDGQVPKAAAKAAEPAAEAVSEHAAPKPAEPTAEKVSEPAAPKAAEPTAEKVSEPAAEIAEAIPLTSETAAGDSQCDTDSDEEELRSLEALLSELAAMEAQLNSASTAASGSAEVRATENRSSDRVDRKAVPDARLEAADEPQQGKPNGFRIETKGVLKKKIRSGKQEKRERRDVETFSIPTAEPTQDAVFDFEQIATPGFGQDATSLAELRGAETREAAEAVEPEAEPAAPVVAEPEAEPAASVRTASSDSAPVLKPISESLRQDVAQFKHVYSNKQGSLCLYEDADGHLVAVDPSRFA